MTDSFYKDPIVYPFFACPNCKRLLKFELAQCPHCRELIDEGQKVLGTALHVTVTQACSLANTISTGDPAVVILLGVTAITLLSEFAWMSGITIISGAIVFVAILRWWRRYGWLGVEDSDLVSAKREMRRSLTLWSAFVCFEIIVLVYALRA